MERTQRLFGKPKIKKAGTMWMVYHWHRRYFYLHDMWEEAIKSALELVSTHKK